VDDQRAVGFGLAVLDPHSQSVGDQGGGLGRADRPTDHAAAKRVEHYEAVQLSVSRGVPGVGVGPERPAGLSAGGFLRAVARTGRAASPLWRVRHNGGYAE